MGNQEKSRNMSEFYIKIYIYIYKQLDATVFHHMFTVRCVGWLSHSFPAAEALDGMAGISWF